jgi:hypothetical protein
MPPPCQYLPNGTPAGEHGDDERCGDEVLHVEEPVEGNGCHREAAEHSGDCHPSPPAWRQGEGEAGDEGPGARRRAGVGGGGQVGGVGAARGGGQSQPNEDGHGTEQVAAEEDQRRHAATEPPLGEGHDDADQEEIGPHCPGGRREQRRGRQSPQLTGGKLVPVEAEVTQQVGVQLRVEGVRTDQPELEGGERGGYREPAQQRRDAAAKAVRVG